MPARAGARDGRLASLARETVTLVFYEAPHRVLECLQAMVVAFGPQREAVLARELTKAFETIKRSTLAELALFVASDGNQQKGEIVLLVAGAGPAPEDISPEVAALLQRLAQGFPLARSGHGEGLGRKDLPQGIGIHGFTSRL